MREDTCEYCDGQIVNAVVRVPFRYKRETIYVDNVPLQKCRRCGDLYFPAAVYRRLEEIAEQRRHITAKITFPLADYRADETLKA